MDFNSLSPAQKRMVNKILSGKVTPAETHGMPVDVLVTSAELLSVLLGGVLDALEGGSLKWPSVERDLKTVFQTLSGRLNAAFPGGV
jgi:hypothetical protein